MHEDDEVLEGEYEETIFECWVGREPDSFTKLETNSVVPWVTEQLEKGLKLHQGIHIVPHLKSEYSS